MDFSSINIQGNIISSEILDKIRSEDNFPHQKPEAFGLARTASIRDEIGMAWSLLRTHWQIYKKRLENLPESDTGTSLTREKWILPFLTELGYEVSIQRAQEVNGKSYAISHKAINRDDFPVLVMGYKDDLDKKRDRGGPRLSPHALVQEYLNHTEHLYALVTNGKQLRLLRDATRLVRMSYLEFDLERMMEEELYADFSILYRVLHITRMPENMDSGPDSVIEEYHQDSLASGTRIREKLSLAVENSIKTLANGFLEQRINTELAEQFEKGSLTADAYYAQMLKLIYRILFLVVIEERKLIYPEKLSDELARLQKIYYRHYSVARLRKLTDKQVYIAADKTDLWQALCTTFLLFEDEHYGKKLGIQPLGSGIFASNALGILRTLQMSNANLIEVIKLLTTFVNDNGVLSRVNYSDLDVEEFGSVYEGLLEYDPEVKMVGNQWSFSFVKGDGRSSSGSHYTPEELVKPLITHSLDYIIADKLLEEDKEDALLGIKVADVACGSGHILLSAARRIAMELASVREGAEQPSPSYFRVAIRDVIRNCIYGVDLNPLAVELTKVALWMEAHNPGEPLNFLDHHIKCGNAIVGLAHFKELENGIATEAFKTLPGDDKTIAATYRKKNTLERKSIGQYSTFDLTLADDSLAGLQKDFANFVRLPENNPEEIAAKANGYKKLTGGKKWYRLKNLADLQVAQFFIPKIIENKDKLTTDAKYRTYLNTGTQIMDRGASMAMASERRFFHWFLEFPEVFNNGGFDCVLGNPPFLGFSKISGAYGIDFLEYLKFAYKPIKAVELVIYFLRRIYSIIGDKKYLAIISTNTVGQGSARIGGLEYILNNEGQIRFAIKSIRWPGKAAVQVSLFSVLKGGFKADCYLGSRKIEKISSYLEESDGSGPAYRLFMHKNLSFEGYKPYGLGFILEPKKARELLQKSAKNQNVVLPYLNGQDLNNDPLQKASRFAISFFDWSEEDARKYQDCFSIIEEKVKPERTRWKKDKNEKEIIGTYNLRKPLPQKWWQYGEKRPALSKTIKNMERVLVIAKTSKTVAFSFTEANQILNSNLAILAFDKARYFSVLQSSFHYHWAWKYCTTMKSDLIYIISTIFETFPFPDFESIVTDFSELDKIGEELHDMRAKLMNETCLGLTKLYNQFHNSQLKSDVNINLSAKEIQKENGKETWSLYNHLEVKKAGDISYQQAVPLIFILRELHNEMDEAVLEAYGWYTDTERWGKAIDLRHDFYEVEYLPENDRVRYTIHPEARKEVLKRLLILNHERYEEEIKQGLHKKKDVVKFYKEKGVEVSEGTVISDGKTSKRVKVKRQKLNVLKAAEPGSIYMEPSLFDEPDLFSTKAPVVVNSKVLIKNTEGKEFRYHILRDAQKGKFTGGYKQVKNTSALAENMLGRKIGDKFVFGGVGYEVIGVE